MEEGGRETARKCVRVSIQGCSPANSAPEPDAVKTLENLVPGCAPALSRSSAVPSCISPWTVRVLRVCVR